MEPKKMLFIVNPRAGRSRPLNSLLQAAATLSEGGYLLCVRRTTHAGHATEIVKQDGPLFDAVVAVGGDGTLNEVVSGLMTLEQPPLLGYLPHGSTNDFAASLAISPNPVVAAEAILRHNVRALDVGTWNGRPFVYVASFGAFARSSYTAPQAAKNALGHFAYILEGLKDISSLRPYRLSITADGETLDGEYLFGAVCNSTSIGGLMRLDPQRVVLDDGKFELLLVPNPKTPQALQNLVRALLEQHYDREGLIFRQVSSLQIETRGALPWSLDGEYAASCPNVEIQNHQKVLSMLL